MSAADNSSNLTNNSTDVYDDELFTWLQYPVDDVFEKSYCSDLFGGLLPPPVAKTHPDATTPSDSLSNVGISICTGSGSSRILSTKKNVGTKSFSRSSSKAEDALALGAARAAGHSSQVGHDTFNKVRTSIQPQAISVITSPCSSLKAFNHKDCSVGKPKIPVPYDSKQPQGGVESSRLHMASSFSMEKTKHALFALTTAEKSRKVLEPHPRQLSHTLQSKSSHISEESNKRVCGKYTSSHSSSVPLSDDAEAKGAMMMSSNSWDVKGKMGWADQTSETPPSYSGGSQTSMSLSFREVAYSGKRKHEDSELRSEDGPDNMRNIKVSRKSSSRRNRVSEVHNLSERNRRNKINDKLKTLQDLIPNSSKTDKASVLDEAIEYMKTLQIQLQMVSMRSGMNMMPMMMPMAFPSTPMHMAPLHSIGLGVPIGPAGMGMGFGADMGHSGRAAPFQSAPAAMTQYGTSFQNGIMASLHESSQACTNLSFLPTHPLPSMQKIHEPSEHIHPRSLSTLYAHQWQQQEQGQRLGYPLLNHEHEQQDGLSD